MSVADETADAGTEYKVSELTDVTDQAMEETLNRLTSEGYRFESIHFVTQPGNRRPAMAFMFFTRGAASGRV